MGILEEFELIENLILLTSFPFLSSKYSFSVVRNIICCLPFLYISTCLISPIIFPDNFFSNLRFPLFDR